MAFKVITIGEQEVPMLALASVDLYYKHLFHEDPLAIMGGDNNGAKSAIAFGMGFVMAKYAEYKDRKRMYQLTEDDYVEWLDQFEYGDYVQVAGEILSLYYGQKKITAIEKNVERP